ncbi:hypothetical protein J1G43_17170 [Cellulomonas sp. zg-ZUI22]|uniref:hypothetical protein n=1 Tax=Cellulomonas sp. zg-ZUI22 TaxID=2816955 RepID=UPI001A93EAFE|nr:hypothetical protein [Cellulomonas sp. zg-ZUI22]MBO0901694.1 hypothetical protein [Cellulomonas sp. zg-ZUI22]
MPARPLLLAPLLVGLLVGGLVAGCSSGAGSAGATPAVAGATEGATPLGPAPTVTPLAAPSPGTGAVDLYVSLNSTGEVFPESVVEAGQHTCERVSYLVQVSEDEFRAALDGPLTLADTAVPLLCPDLLGPLARARGGIGEGESAVAAGDPGAVAPGEYRSVTAAAGCTWSVRDGAGATSSQGGVATAGEVATLVVGATDAAVNSAGCGLWLPVAG